MEMHFLFPADPLRSNVADEMFADQFVAVKKAGYSASLCPDPVLQEAKPLRNIPSGATVVYRGWMLNAVEYSRLAQAVDQALATLLTSVESYLSAHHLPNWYPLIAEFTPETRASHLMRTGKQNCACSAGTPSSSKTT
jgi:hypothetical protein